MHFPYSIKKNPEKIEQAKEIQQIQSIGNPAEQCIQNWMNSVKITITVSMCVHFVSKINSVASDTFPYYISDIFFYF